jgi:hypothetical protein
MVHQLPTSKNVFVTNGAGMTSTSTQNPSLTYTVFLERVANHAIEETKKGICDDEVLYFIFPG